MLEKIISIFVRIYKCGLTIAQRSVKMENIETQQVKHRFGINDSHVDITRRQGQRISIIGVENISARRQFPSYGNVGKAMAGANGEYKIMLSHDPTSWDKHIVRKTDIDLTLSGHTHETQFSIFGLSPCSSIFHSFVVTSECSPDCPGDARMSALSHERSVPYGQKEPSVRL